ncbi:MAG: hypothetical protein QF441_01395 [Bacteriovoracaceae bacterium]|jgi:hypothetical protein|nr:hypothetical protein [Bacteriovoracaceae bacterium]|tara:strand:- start:50 stop:685 length:636 start_codon:yes stop_codon:yes gene_type:complete
MKFILKGVCHQDVSEQVECQNLEQLSFDFRPKSFNFIQGYKVLDILKKTQKSYQYSLMFDNEKDFVISEFLKKTPDDLSSSIFLEFFNESSLEFMEKFGKKYFWHYNDKVKIRDISQCQNIDRIIFTHEHLELLHQQGELFGFFQLFSDYFHKVMIEVQLNWNTELISSLVDMFQIPLFSFEISHEVEKSYQNPDYELISNILNNLSDQLN